jgi:hypothetical protein
VGIQTLLESGTRVPCQNRNHRSVVSFLQKKTNVSAHPRLWINLLFPPFWVILGFQRISKVIHICGETSDPLTFLGWKSGGTNRSTGFRVSTRANGLSLHSNLRNFNFDIPTVATNVAPLIPAGLIGLIIFGSAYHPKKNTAPQPQSQLFQRHIHQLPRAAGTDAVADRARQRGLWPGWEICLICVAQWPCGLIWHMWINSIYMAMQSL